jgi:hypothetical protein
VRGRADAPALDQPTRYPREEEAGQSTEHKQLSRPKRRTLLPQSEPTLPEQPKPKNQPQFMRSPWRRSLALDGSRGRG